MQWNLIRLRKERKLYQEHVAKLIGVSTNAYGMKERGEQQFTADEMFLLSDYFDRPMDQIFLPRNFGVAELNEDSNCGG